MTLKAGIKKDGTLTALQLTASGESGAYPAGGVQLLDFQITELVHVPQREVPIHGLVRERRTGKAI